MHLPMCSVGVAAERQTVGQQQSNWGGEFQPAGPELAMLSL